jgi:hypothetical protein
MISEAWHSLTEPPAENEKKTFKNGYEIFLDYSEYSTIQGLIYIFFSYQVYIWYHHLSSQITIPLVEAI